LALLQAARCDPEEATHASRDADDALSLAVEQGRLERGAASSLVKEVSDHVDSVLGACGP
jgi:hypothetical protein